MGLRLTDEARVYLDANILIHIVEGHPANQSAVDRLLRLIEADAMRAFTSELSLAEVLVKPLHAADRRLLDLYEQLLAPGGQLDVVSIDRIILRRAAEVKATVGGKLPDAVHVATALQRGCSHFLSEDSTIRKPPALTSIKLQDLVG